MTNIGLDYLFMGAFHMGPAGAALGTTLAQVVSVCIAFAAIRKKNLGIPMKKEDFKPQGKIMGQLLQVGIPVALQDGLIQVAFIIITIIANRRGLDDCSCRGHCGKNDQLRISGAVFPAVHRVGALCAEYGRRKI